MINVNEYFEGKIKSLGFEVDGIQYTAGVFSAGTYSITTEKEEHITVTLGGFEIRMPGSDWKELTTGDAVVIPPDTAFDVRVTKAASYICIYK